jgi:hypothetical protein
MRSHVSYPEAISSSTKNHYLKTADAKVTSALLNQGILCSMCMKGKQNREGTSDWPLVCLYERFIAETTQRISLKSITLRFNKSYQANLILVCIPTLHEVQIERYNSSQKRFVDKEE